MRISPSSIHRVPVIAAAMALMAFATACAATFSASAVPPARVADDISNIPELPAGVATGADKWWSDPATTSGNPGMTVGQTFTTGNGAFLLKSVTFRVRDGAQPNKNYTVRVGRVTGATFTMIASETATQSIATVANAYWTWTFDAPVLLSPNTLYGVDVGLNSSSSSWQTGIPYVHYTTADTFPLGHRFRSGSAGNGVGNSSISQITGDRIFHIALAKPLDANLNLVATSPADDDAGVLASRELVATFSQNLSLGTGEVIFRNLTDSVETRLPIHDPRISISENVLSIRSDGLIDWGKRYAIRITPGAILGEGGVVFGGIADDTTWNFSTAAGDPLLDVISGLRKHIIGSVPLSAAQIAAHKIALDDLRQRFSESGATINAVFDLVRTYDSVKGPLWVARGEFGNRSTQPNDLDWTIYHVMQAIMDQVYTPAVLATQEPLLTGFKFGSSANFPGPCAPPSDPTKSHTVRIQGSFPNTFGRITQGDDLPARKPTGCYLAPGTIVTVMVPPVLVNKGYQVRVGAHSWDLTNRPPVRRLDRATLLYPITATTIKVASPYGGGIYIEVPRLANAGVVDVTITGAVRSPYFSAKSFHRTTQAEWLVERTHPAPWADFQSDKFMMQVPTQWISAHPDPTKLMADWDKAMDAQNELMGFPALRGKETQYPQVDVIMRASVHAPGYPSVNNVDNPNSNRGGYHTNYLVRGPGASFHSAHIEFHEQGHAYFFPKFGGETESNVNLPHVAIMHRKFGYTLDEAFRGSLGSTRTFQTLDTTAVAWMTVFNFAPRRSPMADGEKAYQLKGHAKFVDIAGLYGWEVLGDYWRSFMEDDAEGVSYATTTDAMLLRLCRNVGKDIRPLFHFWGIHPQNNASLSAALAAENISLDPAIRDRLLHYQSLVPATNAAFRNFATSWWGKQPSIGGYWEEREHARQWDTAALYTAGDQQRSEATNPGEIYNETSAADIRSRVNELLELYFPVTIAPSPMGFSSLPAAVDEGGIAMAAMAATSRAGSVEYLFENTTKKTRSGWIPGREWRESGLAAGALNWFRVKARDALGHETAWSAEFSATTPASDPPFEAWAAGFSTLLDPSPATDFDRGGLSAAIEWVVGGDPTNPADDAGLVPTFDAISDPDGKFLFVFRRSQMAHADANTVIQVQYSNGPGGWRTALHQGDGADEITITEEPGTIGPGVDPMTDKVTVAFPATLADGGRLFARLHVTVSQP